MIVAMLLVLLSCQPKATSEAEPGPEASVWLEKLTWTEVRDLIHAGHRRVLVPTGGIEQSGPYVVLGKHNEILQFVCVRLAQRLGNTLVAPVVKFVPEGRIDPPDGHMLFPGTISVSDETFHSLLTDTVASLRTHGFNEIVLLGDSGGNQPVMGQVARELRDRWPNCRVLYLAEFYDYERLRQWLRDNGYNEQPHLEHEELAFSAQLAVFSPESIRYDKRSPEGVITLNGVTFSSLSDLRTLGEKLIELRLEDCLTALRAAGVAEAAPVNAGTAASAGSRQAPAARAEKGPPAPVVPGDDR